MKTALVEKVMRKYEHQKKIIVEVQAVHDQLKIAEADLSSARSRILSLTTQAEALGSKYAAGPADEPEIDATK